MTMLRTCAADGCMTKTLGEFCIDHEAARGPVRSAGFDFKRVQPRGRMRSISESEKFSPTGERSR